MAIIAKNRQLKHQCQYFVRENRAGRNIQMIHKPVTA